MQLKGNHLSPFNSTICTAANTPNMPSPGVVPVGSSNNLINSTPIRVSSTVTNDTKSSESSRSSTSSW